MRNSPAVATFVAGLAVLSAGPKTSTAAEGCSSDAFAVRGTPLVVTLCAAPTAARPGAKAGAAVVETIAAKGQEPIVRRVTIDAPLGDAIARTIDDAPLTALGIAGTLHMTIAYRGGSARLEHALLVPGAIVLK